MKILFWNIDKKAHKKLKVVESLLLERKPDLFFMAEANVTFKMPDQEYVEISLKASSSQFDQNIPLAAAKIPNQPLLLAFARKGVAIVRKEYFLHTRMALCVVDNGSEQIAICGIHYWSKLDKDNQEYFGKDMRDELYRICSHYKKVLIIGDFNMAPWDSRMCGVTGFNAIPWGEEVRQKPTMSKGGDQLFFLYNPMWNFLGDDATAISLGARGSFRAEEHPPLEWHHLDQVICSEPMIDLVKASKIEFVVSVEIPHRSQNLAQLRQSQSKDLLVYSHHYPISCTLN